MLPIDVAPSDQCRPLGVDLASFGDRTAIVTARDRITYVELATRVDAAARRLGTGRLVLLAGANTVDCVVAYLGALAAGCPVLLTAADDASILAMTRAYDPDVVVGPVDGRWTYRDRRVGTAHELHPELALLLSTSGSTGSPKLVRLSAENLRANAASIATYLDIRDTDRAATTLPLHYCYGLSVVNSHLLRGAALIVTDLSVADTCFWELFRLARGTSLAGVPYTFALLDRGGFADMDLPDLRYITQAGGRLAPERVRYFAELGQRQGWDMFVMYGQTEATARMAYLPSDLAITRPQAIGLPVPGGALRLEPVEGGADDVGELIYTGPNVMLGYADSPADLALGRTVEELRTGDLARRTPDGLYEIVGRCSRFAKVFGLRIDLQRVEAGLEADGVTAACVGVDDELVVVVQGHSRQPARLDRLVAQRSGLPVRAVRVVAVPDLPRLASGKVDLTAVAAIGAPAPPTPRPAQATELCAIYAEVLDRPAVTGDDTFVGLGGDSLSYVEMSVRLEAALGALPAGWHTTPIRDLPAPRSGSPRPWRWLDTGVALRATAIVLIVGSHIGVYEIRGGAHLLLAVAGFNFARFHLSDADRRARRRHVAASIARIAVPTMVYVALVHTLLGQYGWSNVFLLNEALGPRIGPERDFWFIETLVYVLGVLLLLVNFADRLERRLPFMLPLLVLGVGLLIRYDVFLVAPTDHLGTPRALFWFFALGWVGGKARGTAQKCLVSAVAVVAVIGYYIEVPLRPAIFLTGFLLLVWVPRVPSVAVVNRLAGLLGGASLYIYLTHWQVYPPLAQHSGVLALAASLVGGVVFGVVVDRIAARLRRLRRPGAAVVPPRPRGIAAGTRRSGNSRASRLFN